MILQAKTDRDPVVGIHCSLVDNILLSVKQLSLLRLFVSVGDTRLGSLETLSLPDRNSTVNTAGIKKSTWPGDFAGQNQTGVPNEVLLHVNYSTYLLTF